MEMDKKEHWEEGNYVCLHCHIIYVVYGNSLCCDLCGKKLRWRDEAQIKQLEQNWTTDERKKGLDPNFAYHRQKL